jgi:hypothetical protein
LTEYISAYLKKDFLSSLSADESKSLCQLFRVQNALTYHMTQLTESHKDQKTLLTVYQEIEETFILASLIREAMKQLFGNGKCLAILENHIESTSVIEDLRSKEAYYAGYKTEINLIFLDMIRNEFSFHFKKSIYDENIRDGVAKEDMHILVSLDETHKGTVYVPSINAALFQVERFVNENNITEAPDNYLYNCVYNETLSLFNFVGTFVREVVKGHCYKKIESF